MTDHWRAGRVKVGPGVLFGLAGIGGSVSGSLLNRRLDPDLLLLAFAELVLVAAWRMVTGCPSCTNLGEREAIGAGGGFIIVPALTLGLRFARPEAIGTSLLIIAINSVTALGPRLDHGGIDWAVTVPFAVSTVAGTLAGSRLADRLPEQTLLRWFAGLLLAVGVYTACRSILALAG